MEQHEQFADKVRAAYLEVFGDEDLESDEPFTLGTVVVGLEVQHLDGDGTSVTIYDGSRMSALGLVVRSRHILEGYE